MAAVTPLSPEELLLSKTGSSKAEELEEEIEDDDDEVERLGAGYRAGHAPCKGMRRPRAKSVGWRRGARGISPSPWEPVPGRVGRGGFGGVNCCGPDGERKASFSCASFAAGRDAGREALGLDRDVP